ncbi:unnamed protein product [Phaedon cochleariae]|uniref:Saposin B-type domain-containing protein n=1 Tax=Phaedon cochleariae TaxID=80249 RepID=A0A9N9X560_PHACE|nr:unnamed protein product [Phaedon cochleariae]
MKLIPVVACFIVILLPVESTNDVEEKEESFSINPVCEVCELAVKEIYKEIGKDKSEQKIKDAVHHACPVLPKKFEAKCNDFVNKHGDEIIQLILKVLSPKVVCHLVHACL